MSDRKSRLADEIRDIIASSFQGGQLNDPRLAGVTITAVKLSGDLQIASVYFRTFIDHPLPDVLAGLKSASGYLRHQLAQVLDVRRVPTLRFFYDESPENAGRIEHLLNQIR